MASYQRCVPSQCLLDALRRGDFEQVAALHYSFGVNWYRAETISGLKRKCGQYVLLRRGPISLLGKLGEEHVDVPRLLQTWYPENVMIP